jgi:hypothetical protein
MSLVRKLAGAFALALNTVSLLAHGNLQAEGGL